MAVAPAIKRWFDQDNNERQRKHDMMDVCRNQREKTRACVMAHVSVQTGLDLRLVQEKTTIQTGRTAGSRGCKEVASWPPSGAVLPSDRNHSMLLSNTSTVIITKGAT